MADETKIRVVGIGAAGVKMLAKISAAKLANVQTVAVDTDVARAENAVADKKLPLASPKTSQGTGGDVNLAKQTAVEYIQYLAKVARRTQTLVLVGGLGGGTASIVAPILAKLAEAPTTVIALCAMPMELEGTTKNNIAKKSFNFLKNKCAAAIALPNELLLNPDLGVEESLERGNEAVAGVVAALAAGFSPSAFLKIDAPAFAAAFSKKDIGAGFACASAEAAGDAFEAIKKSPMFSANFDRAETVLISIRCPKTASMNEIKSTLKSGKDAFNAENIIFSLAPDVSISTFEILAIATPAPAPAPQAAGIVPAQVAVAESPAAEAANTGEVSFVSNEKPSAQVQAGIPAQTSDVPDSSLTRSPEPPADEVDDLRDEDDKSVSAPAPQTAAPVEYKPDLPKESKKSTAKEQMSFVFDERGLFENTPTNERKGIDIDIPTFTRKKIKITLL